MITTQKIGKLLILFLIVAGLASCNDDDPAPFGVIGEAIIVKRKVNDEVKYARYFYAYGNYSMTSAKVKLPEGGEITLESLSNNKYSYGYVPDTSKFTTTLPSVGKFKFTVQYDGEEYTDDETLEYHNLAIPVIDSISYSNQAIHVKWELPTSNKPNYYQARMVDKDSKLVFSGLLLNNTANKIDVSSKYGDFVNGHPKKGETYKIEIYAYKYESGATGTDQQLRNIDDIAIGSSEEIVWGE